MKNIMKKAFTLAEVLITLGIIGIVAVLTLPTLISKHQEKQWKVAYKKAHSSMGQAFLMMHASGEYENPFEDAHYSELTGGGQMFWSPACGRNFLAIAKYFKYKKACFNKDADKCWECGKGQAGYIYHGAPNWFGCNKANYAFVDGSGMAWYIYSKNEYPVIVDVNGFKGPNKLGKDRFVIKFAMGNKRDNYVEEANTMKPWSDVKAKGRWCPEGNCMYASWLLE